MSQLFNKELLEKAIGFELPKTHDSSLNTDMCCCQHCFEQFAQQQEAKLAKLIAKEESNK